MEKSENFYKNVEAAMSKHKLSSMVYDFLFRSPNKIKPHRESLTELRFVPYEGDHIEKLRYKHLKIFGTDINDTSYYRIDKLTDIVNKTHLHTSRILIRKNLLFRGNEKVVAEDLVESERLLRRLPVVKDAQILIAPGSDNESAVVTVVTKDVFPYNFEIYPNNDNGALFGLSHINIGGVGHEIEYNNVDTTDYELYYRIRSMFGTYIDLELDYSQHFQKSGTGFKINRDFASRQTRVGGGIEYSSFQFGETSFEPETERHNDLIYNRDRQDIWLGYAFETKFRARAIGFSKQTHAVVSARLDHQEFYNKPEVRLDTNYRFHDRTNYLAGIGLSTREYFKDKFIRNFGRTEDIPTGVVMALVGGVQQREFEYRTYLGANYSRGGYFYGFGYTNYTVSLGAFLRGDGIRDGVFNAEVNYYTPLAALGKYKFRQFIDLQYSQAINPTEAIIMDTQSDLGLRGVSGYHLSSTQHFNFSAESLLFTPAIFLGFRLATFAFFDYAATDNNRSTFFGPQSFYGYGIGFRLRNDNLAFSTIQLSFGMYPKLPLDPSYSLARLSTSTRLRVRDFTFQSPEIVPFR